LSQKHGRSISLIVKNQGQGLANFEATIDMITDDTNSSLFMLAAIVWVVLTALALFSATEYLSITPEFKHGELFP